MNRCVNRWIRPEVRNLTAYRVEDASGLIKLDAMENPYSWPEEMQRAWLNYLQGVGVNRYPDPGATELQQHIRAKMGVPESMGLLLGNGSDELIQMLALAVGSPDKVLMAPEPSFVMYRMTAIFTGMSYIGVPLKDDFALDLPKMLAEIRERQPALIFLAYPNNPTGNLFADVDIEAILQAAEGLVIVDEAYHAFAGQSWMERLGEYENLLVMRTFSKLGLAGLRLGFLAGPSEFIAELNKVRMPYNINVLTQQTVIFALQHLNTLELQCKQIVAERELMQARLQAMPSVEAYPSAANFILLALKNHNSDTVCQQLKEHGIQIKSMGMEPGPLAGMIRITIGTPEENQSLLDALQELIA